MWKGVVVFMKTSWMLWSLKDRLLKKFFAFEIGIGKKINGLGETVKI